MSQNTKSIVIKRHAKWSEVSSLGFELNCAETQVIGAAMMELAERTYCRVAGTTYDDFSLRADTL